MAETYSKLIHSLWR